MTDIQKQLGIDHHFTTAYSPWANGTVEAVCKQTIRAARAMLSEMHLAPQEWPCVLPDPLIGQAKHHLQPLLATQGIHLSL
jgi:hypothetical protein